MEVRTFLDFEDGQVLTQQFEANATEITRLLLKHAGALQEKLG